jgi:hypothetical protein
VIALLLATGLAGNPAPPPAARTWCRHLAHSAGVIAEAKLSGVSRLRMVAAAVLIADEQERSAMSALIELAYDGNAGDQASPAELAGITYSTCMRGD